MSANLYKTDLSSIKQPEIEVEPLERVEPVEPTQTVQVTEPELPTVPQEVDNNLPSNSAVKEDYTKRFVSRAPWLPKIELNWGDIGDRTKILDAQLKAESGYNPKVVSSSGAQGIAQIMPSTWQDLQKQGRVPAGTTPFDVGAALQGQRSYMEAMYEKEHVRNAPDSLTMVRRALASYNAGYGNVTKAVEKAKAAGDESRWEEFLPRVKETIPYMDRIIQTAVQHKESNYNPQFNWGYKKQGGILITTKI